MFTNVDCLLTFLLPRARYCNAPGDGPAKTAALAAFKSKAIPALREALKVFDTEMRAKAAPPTDE